MRAHPHGGQTWGHSRESLSKREGTQWPRQNLITPSPEQEAISPHHGCTSRGHTGT